MSDNMHSARYALRGPAVSVIATLATLACSPILVDGPPKHARKMARPLPCTISRGVPWLDTGASLLLALATVEAVRAPCDRQKDTEGLCGLQVIPIVVAGALAVGFGASAIWGHVTVGDCREANARLPDPPPPPPAAPLPPPGEIWIDAVAGPGGADVRDTPAATAHLRAHVAPEQSLKVSTTAHDGWLSVPLPDGTQGFVLGREIEIPEERPPSERPTLNDR